MIFYLPRFAKSLIYQFCDTAQMRSQAGPGLGLSAQRVRNRAKHQRRFQRLGAE